MPTNVHIAFPHSSRKRKECVSTIFVGLKTPKSKDNKILIESYIQTMNYDLISLVYIQILDLVWVKSFFFLHVLSTTKWLELPKMWCMCLHIAYFNLKKLWLPIKLCFQKTFSSNQLMYFNLIISRRYFYKV